jgi:tetratricopeptide (TPR) repeat protein
LGYDSPTVAYSYSNLGLYYHTCQYFLKGFEFMHRSLKILEIVCGSNHPDISSIYLNLGMMYQDVENYNAAIDCYMDSLFRNIALYGENHYQVASCYQAIAHAHYLKEDFRMALDNQEKSHLILKNILPPESEYVVQSQKQLNQFMHLSVQQEKFRAEKGGRAIGDNKPKLSEKEKEEAKKRKGIEEYIRRMQQMEADPKNKGFFEML